MFLRVMALLWHREDLAVLGQNPYAAGLPNCLVPLVMGERLLGPVS